MNNDEKYIKRCLELASKAKGLVSPNPLVGAVIVDNGEVISEDYHRSYGGFHAERNAILKLDEYDFSNAEIYCNLEPCTHFGKTPPCSDLIISKNFKRVIFGCFDPNPLVAGKSLQKFREAGITTAFKVLDNESKFLNRFFYKHIQTNTPWVIAKWAESHDGYISSGKGTTEKVTGRDVQIDVHSFRAEVDAILVGTNTTLIDNPSLNVRLANGRNPHKILIDPNLEVPINFNLYNEPEKSIIVCTKSANPSKKEKIKLLGARVIELELDQNHLFDLNKLLSSIGKLGLNSLLIEGGANLLNQFFDQNLVDEIHSYRSNIKFGDGLKIHFDKDQFKKYEEIELGKDHSIKYTKADSQYI